MVYIRTVAKDEKQIHGQKYKIHGNFLEENK